MPEPRVAGRPDPHAAPSARRLERRRASPAGWSRAASTTRRRSSCPASSRAAAASSTSSPPTGTTRCGSSCSATRSSRSAASRSPRSGASARLDAGRRHDARAEPRARRAIWPTTCRRRAGSCWSSRTSSRRKARRYLERLERPQDHARRSTTCSSEVIRFPSVTASAVAAGSLETTCQLQIESVERFSGDIGKVRDELDAAGGGPGGVRRLPDRGRGAAAGRGVRRARELARRGQAAFPHRHAEAHGFRLVAERIVLVSSGELFHRDRPAPPAPAPAWAGRSTASSSCARATSSSTSRTASAAIAACSCWRRTARPKSTWSSSSTAARSSTCPARRSSWCRSTSAARRAGRRWPSSAAASGCGRRQAAEEAVTDLAADMLELQAARAPRPGIAFPADTEWQREFDAAFPYQETPDQLAAIDAIKGDMHAAAADGPAALRRRRLRQDGAGDAGGVQGGRRRLPGGRARADDGAGRAALAARSPAGWPSFPFEIAALSRFCHAEGAGARSSSGWPTGAIDIVIGTHRLASARRAVPEPGPGDHRRGAAVRRRGQGAAQGAAARRSTC